MKKWFANTVMAIDVAFLVWAMASWANVVCNNTAPYGELAAWNLFAIIFG